MNRRPCSCLSKQSTLKLYANSPDIVERFYRRRVWIVSPTILMVTFNMVRTVRKDAHTRRQTGVIQEEVLKLVDDLGRLHKRIENLEKHFDHTVRDVRGIRISSNKIPSRGGRIITIVIGDEEDEVTEAQAPPVETDQ
ncbi:MAG: DNA recombination protein RmuC [Alphaproteobacteria bacterium]|nr:DNA recombination protein RmuC [Alphaproteobacteria bacterium]MDP7172632.1 DNA recombination protein RmuC [Alphaproteobacteria bacterium]MDP7233886.1 DNA recombination protein RmuC [Alphaproteobacteria bacterium]MDP7488449.1 DNA recombination protein RmuC [Alphaproteobacteria bacterium]MEE1545233.1 DNA recombination protein RmuC [Alphaproteobacteria bacterium]